jgi:hypothetical protein
MSRCIVDGGNWGHFALDHDDFGSNRSKIMNVIDSNSLGPVGIQDSHPSLVVIQAADGPIRFN